MTRAPHTFAPLAASHARHRLWQRAGPANWLSLLVCVCACRADANEALEKAKEAGDQEAIEKYSKRSVRVTRVRGARACPPDLENSTIPAARPTPHKPPRPTLRIRIHRNPNNTPRSTTTSASGCCG